LNATRTEILNWISTISYISHHKRISDGRLAGTCEWILGRKKFCSWKSLSVSKVMLRGIPGAGKTYAASRAIDSYLSTPADGKLAYFCCNRAEENRRDPENILSALIEQLVQTDSEALLQPVLEIYTEREKNGQTSSRLTLTESEALLLQLTDIHPRTTICIDAFDEIDHTVRLKLLHALKHLVERSKNLVKIFATTRMDIDIFLQFETFPRIQLQPDDNVTNIIQFVKMTVRGAIEDKELLHGNVPYGLKDEICEVLCEQSRGMAVQVPTAALQITFLCNMSTADDVRRSLKTLPDTLIDAYAEIFNRIMAHSGNAPQLAVKAFRWLQYSYEPLRSETLLDAITMQVHGCGHFPHNPTVKANELLKACHILIILDERLNVFRFAHLSVVECLDFKLAKVDTHTKIAKVCLSFLCTLDSWYDYDWTLNTEEEHHSERHMFWYAAVFWPWHFGHGGEGCP
ncbi:hypothetical protein BZA05DRAFT_464062, partial [Tricharina praecox]|uniref:uncharacterized protein n=1 Tax=Tricharina praecox TaxID=43433 RepID=UPI00221F1FA3